MNKKFSTLLSGFLLMSAFASAQNVQPANELKSGKSYFVVADVDGIPGLSRGDLFLEATDVNDNYSVKGVNFTPDNKNLTWTFTENKFKTPEGTTYYYSLKNDEVGSYLKFVNGTVVEADKVDDAYFKATTAADVTYTNGAPLIYVEDNQRRSLVVAATGVTLGEPGTNILFCEYAKNTLTPNVATAALFNDVKGGSGFNLKFSSGNSYGWANDILTDLNLKAFYVNVASWGNIDPDGNNMFTILPGIYFATEYPASLNNENEITERADFEACTFLAVNPDKNYDIHQADRGQGIGFDLMTVSGSDLNVYTVQEDDKASVKGDVFVGNACFTIEVPDPLRAENAYNLMLANARVQTDASKSAHAYKPVYIGSILDQNKNYLVTNTTGLSFETTNSTLYDVTKLLKSEDAPSIYTFQFVSELYKNDNINFAGEKNHYLTVGVQDDGAGNNVFALHSVEDYNAADPMFQFVITNVDKDNKTVDFTNRQTQKWFRVSLYENEDGSFTVYDANAENLYVEKFDDLVWGDETHNGEIVFENTPDNGRTFYTLNNTKVVLTPVTVEDKFATFVNRSDNDGLVTFELAKNVDDTPEFYVGARKNNGVIIENRALVGYANARNMTQFELEKVDRIPNTPEVDHFWISNPYVYKNGSRILTSTVQDTVAYYKYQIKVFEELNGDGQPYYLDNNMQLDADDYDWNNNAWNLVTPEEFIIKENIDGSVSLIPTINNNNPDNLDFVNLRYAEEGGNLQVNAANNAWRNGLNYDLASKLSVGLKTFMVEEDPAISYEAIPQHVSFEAVRGGFMTKDENSDARLSITNVAAEDLTFWLDTVHSDRNVPSFYILKNGAYMFNAADSAVYYGNRGNDRFNIDNVNAKLIFKTGELVTSDTLRTTVDGRSVLVAEEDNAPKGIKGGLENFQFQIIQAEAGSDEYVIRQNGAYVCLLNNYFFVGGNKDMALRFIIEKQAAPTANEGIEVSEVKVIAGNGQITIMGAAGKQVVVSNILGKVVANQMITTDNATIAVPAGIIAVAVEGEAAVKAIVK